MHNAQRFIELVHAYDVITIFRHVSPDSDALGSQFGLKCWIEEHYPNKQVYALGHEEALQAIFPRMDVVEDSIIQKSLAIIVDTANGARVDDQRYHIASNTLKIDHHVVVDSYANEAIVDECAGATCEILTLLFQTLESTLSSTCATFLYGGLIADTLKFSIRTTSKRTLQAASYLLNFDVDIPYLNELNFSTTLKQFKYENFIRSNCTVIDDCIAYMIVNKEDYEAYDLTFAQAKEKVFVLGGVVEFQVWALFTEKEKDASGKPLYNGSLRSKNVSIDDIAQHYHGGGHHLACGVKQLTQEDIKALLEELNQRVHSKL